MHTTRAATRRRQTKWHLEFNMFCEIRFREPLAQFYFKRTMSYILYNDIKCEVILGRGLKDEFAYKVKKIDECAEILSFLCFNGIDFTAAFRTDSGFLMFGFARLPGLPAQVFWPVKIHSVKENKVLVYSKSDDAWFNIKEEFMKEFSDIVKWKNLAIKYLRKKPETLKAFLDDLQWTQTCQVDDADNGGVEVEKTGVCTRIPAIDDEVDDADNGGVEGEKTDVCSRIPAIDDEVDDADNGGVEREPAIDDEVDGADNGGVEGEPAIDDEVDEADNGGVEGEPAIDDEVDDADNGGVDGEPAIDDEVDDADNGGVDGEPAIDDEVDEADNGGMEGEKTGVCTRIPAIDDEVDDADNGGVEGEKTDVCSRIPAIDDEVDDADNGGVEREPAIDDEVDGADNGGVEGEPAIDDEADNGGVEGEPAIDDEVDDADNGGVEGEPAIDDEVDDADNGGVDGEPAIDDEVDEADNGGMEGEPAIDDEVDEADNGGMEGEKTGVCSRIPAIDDEVDDADNVGVDGEPAIDDEVDDADNGGMEGEKTGVCSRIPAIDDEVDDADNGGVEGEPAIDDEVDGADNGGVEGEKTDADNGGVDGEPAIDDEVDEADNGGVEGEPAIDDEVDDADNGGVDGEPAIDDEVDDADNGGVDGEPAIDDEVDGADNLGGDEKVREGFAATSFRGKKRKLNVIYDSDDTEREDPPVILVSNSESEDSNCSEVYPRLSKKILEKACSVPCVPESDSELDDEDEVKLTSPVARDVNNNDIFVALVQRNKLSKSGKRKRHERVYDARHPCPFCKKTVANFSHHIFSKKHCNEVVVKEINEIEDVKERKKEITKLRLKAAHDHNLKVMEARKGEIYLLRRSAEQNCSIEKEDGFAPGEEILEDAVQQSKINISKYGPCPQCFGWILLKSIKRHMKACSASDAHSVNSSKGTLILQSNILCGKVPEEASKALQSEVLPLMEKDEVFNVATTDSLIISLGNQWMMRNRGNAIMRPYYTSSVMRLAAKLKLDKTAKGLDEYFRPSNFSIVVKAALFCCNQSEVDEEDLKSPSNAIKLGYDIKRMVSAKLAKSLMNGDECRRKEAEEFLKLMEIEWSMKVTKLARDLLSERSFNRVRKLPLPEDVKKLALYIQAQLKDLDFTEVSYANFRKTAILSLVRVTLYNRRRCHEVQAMRLQSYAARKMGVDEIAQEMRGELTQFETQLLLRQEVVVIRGKKGKGVPVILPGDVKEALQYLSNSDVRQKAGIKASNPYLFSNAQAGVFRAYDAIRSVARESAANLEQPDLIRTSNMRKYMATMLQALNTTDAERQWVMDHLGHTLNVHQIHYRQTADLLERIDVAKVLLIQDLGLVGKYRGKTLQDIQLDDIVTDGTLEESIEETADADQDGERLAEIGSSADCTVDEDFIPDLSQQMEDDDDEEDDEEDIPRRKKRKECTVRQRWTREEEEEIQELFQREFRDTLHCPGQKRIEKMMEKSKKNNGLIYKRKRDTLKKKISNMLIKIKSK